MSRKTSRRFAPNRNAVMHFVVGFAPLRSLLSQLRSLTTSATGNSPLFVGILTGCLCLSPAIVPAQIPAFSGAEGYGGTFSGTAPAAGWFSDASVYHVTNLDDSGPGSLRNAFVQNSTNKVIVFDVAGTIRLTSGSLDIKNLSNYYIAGQTAPGPVTVYGDTVQLTHSGGKENRNVVLRYLSFRKGIGEGSDSITFAGGGLGTHLILDHLSASWSEDEILSVANNNTNVTVQYSTIHDALVSNHAYGSLIRPRISSEVSFHHNLYANNASRQAQFGTYNGETLTADFRNNVIYNYRDRASYTGGSSEAEQEYTDVNYVGNYIVAGPGTQSDGNTAYSVDKNVDTRVYQAGNYIDGDQAPGGAAADGVLDGTDTGWAMFRVSTPVTDQSLTQMATPFPTPPVTTQSAPDAYRQVVDHVGNWWWDRDPIDSRVLGNVTNFTGVAIGAAAPNSSELSHLLAAPQVNHPAGYDTDGDAMPDSWEIAHGLNPGLTSDWNLDFDNDGYINLIEFLNEQGEFPAPAPIRFTGATNFRYAEITNWRTDDGGVTAGSHWQPSKYDTAVINSGLVTVDAVGQHAGLLQIAPQASDDATLQMSSGWLQVNDIVQVGSASGLGKLSIDNGSVLFAPLVAVELQGQFSGTGEVVGSVWNAGLVAPGDGVGTLSIDGDFAQEAGGQLVVDLASIVTHDQLSISGTALLDGTIDVRLDDGFLPNLGDFFTIVEADGGVQGNFATQLVPTLGSGLTFQVVYAGTEVTLQVVSQTNPDFNGDGAIDGMDIDDLVAEIVSGTSDLQFDLTGDGIVDTDDLDQWLMVAGAANLASQNPYLYGDANLDGVVDVGDFNAWNGHRFTNSAAWTLGDFNADGAIDVGDFSVWNAHKFTSSHGLVTVPEPATAALFLVGALLIYVRRIG